METYDEKRERHDRLQKMAPIAHSYAMEAFAVFSMNCDRLIEEFPEHDKADSMSQVFNHFVKMFTRYQRALIKQIKEEKDNDK